MNIHKGTHLIKLRKFRLLILTRDINNNKISPMLIKAREKNIPNTIATTKNKTIFEYLFSMNTFKGTKI